LRHYSIKTGLKTTNHPRREKRRNIGREEGGKSNCRVGRKLTR